MGRTDTLVQRVEVEDSVSATLKFKNGAIVCFTGTLAARASKSPKFEIFGESGVLSLVRGRIEGKRPSTLLFSDGEGRKTVAGIDRPSTLLYWSKVSKWTTGLLCVPSVNALVRNLKGFLASVLEDKEPLVPGEEGRKSLEITIGIYESSKKGELIRFPVKS